jgi:hypothetical protein
MSELWEVIITKTYEEKILVEADNIDTAYDYAHNGGARHVAVLEEGVDDKTEITLVHEETTSIRRVAYAEEVYYGN